MALYDHEGTRGLAPSSILGQAPMNNKSKKPIEFKFVDPRNDVAFRKIFGDENKKEILISLKKNGFILSRMREI
jgi:hypothetical protein